MKKRLFINASVITPYRVLPHGAVVVSGGKIEAVSEDSRGFALENYEVADAAGFTLSPGFVDIHIHGGGGYDFMTATPQEMCALCAAHAKHGTTSILPTTMAAPIDDVLRSVANIRLAQEQADSLTILGAHLEGPFLSLERCGAQNPEYIIPAMREDYERLLASWDQIRIVGAAPEIPGGMELGRALRDRGIVASVAHSDADFDTCLEALENGYSDITHIYCGCSNVKRVNAYRTGGVVEAGLYDDRFTVQAIADGKHLPASLLKLIYKCKGADRITLITDALFGAASGLREGEVVNGANGLRILLEDGVMIMEDHQSFAGSACTTDRLVRNMVELADIPLPDAVRMASATPARIAGADRRKGSVAPGMDADILLLDHTLNVRMTMSMGRIVHDTIGIK